MERQPSRRSFIAAAGAAAAATAVPPSKAAVLADQGGPAYRSAGELVQALANRQVSSRELVDSAIARIEALDSKINAVVVRDFDRARAAADAADAALARGERQPLLGLPLTVKEQFNIAGLPTTWGFPKFKDWRPDADALVVQRLKAAGAIVLGKTNVPINLGDWQSYNEIYGTTNNPWDLKRTPGGSSGGAAAALAAGFVSLEFGSDIGGSLRAPAHFCGVFSHKPSLDLVPQRGALPPQTPAVPVRGDLAVIGPMARTAADLALELSVVAGPDDWMEGIGYKLALPPQRHDKLADFHVLVIDEHPLCPTAASISTALDGLADRLSKTGCTILRASPNLPDLALTSRVYRELLSAFFSADLPPETRERIEAAAKALSPEDQSLESYGLRGAAISHSEWVRQSRIRSGLRGRWQALFQEVDVVLCPPMPTTAFPHDHSPQLARKLDVDGAKIPYLDQMAWAGLATLNGLPATTMPVGHDDAGLPIGVQIIGGYLDDNTTIAFAGLVEREFGGFTPPPGL
ncbi:MAG: amidase [Alphaproteobacteria bacterium]|nr:amidase [Alphaproteobacteria bacterium]